MRMKLRSFLSGVLLSVILLATIVANSRGFNLRRTIRQRNNRGTTTWDGTVVAKRKYLDRSKVALDSSIQSNERGQISKRRAAARHLIPLSTALVIGSFSVFEIVKDLSEVAARRIGHAHGVSILAFIRFCRSAAILQTQTEEFEEQIEEIKEKTRATSSTQAGGSTILAKLGRRMVSPVLTIAACIFASVASLIEIIDDLKPGAHHGTILLSLSELLYQVGRYRSRGEGDKNIDAKPSENSVAANWFSRIPFRALVALAAAVYSGIELYEDFRPGAHHGVALLALAELSENFQRYIAFR